LFFAARDTDTDINNFLKNMQNNICILSQNKVYYDKNTSYPKKSYLKIYLIHISFNPQSKYMLKP